MLPPYSVTVTLITVKYPQRQANKKTKTEPEDYKFPNEQILPIFEKVILA